MTEKQTLELHMLPILTQRCRDKKRAKRQFQRDGQCPKDVQITMELLGNHPADGWEVNLTWGAWKLPGGLVKGGRGDGEMGPATIPQPGPPDPASNDLTALYRALSDCLQNG